MWWSKKYSICAVLSNMLKLRTNTSKSYSTWVNVLSYDSGQNIWLSLNLFTWQEFSPWVKLMVAGVRTDTGLSIPTIPITQGSICPCNNDVATFLKSHVWSLKTSESWFSLGDHCLLMATYAQLIYCCEELINLNIDAWFLVGASQLSIATAVIQVIRGISRPNTKKKKKTLISQTTIKSLELLEWFIADVSRQLSEQLPDKSVEYGDDFIVSV